jgi:predicted RNase H-like HicB family nuclease
MNLTFETELETDGRWIAEVPQLPGVMAYGNTEQSAMTNAKALALRALAEQIENKEIGPRMLARIAKATGLEPDDI